MSAVADLYADSLFAADRAFLDSQAEGETVAQSVRAALAAYVSDVQANAGAEVQQYVATLPEGHPDLAGGQVLARTFDGGESWEFITRPDTYSTWSIGVKGVPA